MLKVNYPKHDLGLYTVSEGALYAGITPAKVRNWFFGYDRKIRGQKIHVEGMINPEITSENEKLITFRDLLEARVIGLFANSLSIQKIKKAKNILQEILDDDYPFSSGKIKTDGKNIFCVSNLDDHVLDVFSFQENMLPVIQRSLIDFDFDQAIPKQWWVKGKEKGIVINPSRSFGQPIEYKSGIPTISLYNMMKSTNDLKKASRFFDVDEDSVQRAYEFHETLNNKNAHLH